MADDRHEAMLRELARAYAAALLTGDEVAAELVIRDALAARLAPAEIDHEIIAPGMWLIGDLWARGEISVAVEHLATEITLRVLALEREAVRTVRRRIRQTLVLATPAGEQHVLALRMAANLLRAGGYDAVLLGADVPPDALVDAVAGRGADVVCLSATMAGVMDKLLIAIDAVQTVRPACGVVLGGRGLTSRVRGLPGVEVCDRVPQVVQAVDAALRRPHTN
jgi:methanogenic corrinoid protein MtbC1